MGGVHGWVDVWVDGPWTGTCIGTKSHIQSRALDLA